MVIGIQNHTLNSFNQTHYYEFVQHRHAVITSLRSVQHKFTFLENFNQTIANIKFPTSTAPTEAYNLYRLFQKENLKKPKPTQTNTLQKSEVIALLRQGVSLPSSSPQTLCHHRVSRLSAQTAATLGGVDGNLLSQGGSSCWPFERGRITCSPSLIRYEEHRAQQNQTLLVLNVISCITALAILYSIASSFLQPFFDRKN